MPSISLDRAFTQQHARAMGLAEYLPLFLSVLSDQWTIATTIGDEMFKGELVSIHIASAKEQPMRQLEEAKAIAGTGLEGDRYSIGAGTFSKPGPGHEITLIEIEAIEALREKNIMLAAGDARRNLVTRGVPLNHLVGRTFQVGEVHLRGVRFCEPCSHLQKTHAGRHIEGVGSSWRTAG